MSNVTDELLRVSETLYALSTTDDDSLRSSAWRVESVATMRQASRVINTVVALDGVARIKTLEWRLEDGTSPEFQVADCPFGTYYTHGFYKCVDLYVARGGGMMSSLGRVQLGADATMDDLKDAAQADFERRVRECLQEDEDASQ